MVRQGNPWGGILARRDCLARAPEAIMAGIVAMVRAASPEHKRMKGLKPSPGLWNTVWRFGFVDSNP